MVSEQKYLSILKPEKEKNQRAKKEKNTHHYTNASK